MRCYGFKAGIGTASRVLPEEQGGWTIGVLVNANGGRRYQLRIDGVPVGREINWLPPETDARGFVYYCDRDRCAANAPSIETVSDPRNTRTRPHRGHRVRTVVANSSSRFLLRISFHGELKLAPFTSRCSSIAA